MAAAHTSSGGAAMSMLVSTSLILPAQASTRPPRERSACPELLAGLPLAQRPLDRGVEPVRAHAEQLLRAVVARQEVTAQAAHERLDEGRVLAGDRRRD